MIGWGDSPFLGALRRHLAALRPRWAWITLACGLPWLLLPARWHLTGTGCLWGLSAAAFWTGALVLGFLGLRWLWLRLLFKVSRRLWMILLLVSFLPALTLTALFVSVGWLGLGAQVGRAFQGDLRRMEAALREAVKQPSDTEALKALEVLSEAHVRRVDALPPGIQDGFVGYVYDTTPTGRKLVALRAVAAEKGRYRLLSLGLGRMSTSGREIWGGRMDYRLDWGSAEKDSVKMKQGDDETPLDFSGLRRDVPAVASYQNGEVVRGGGLLRAFRLPPVGLRVVDWDSGRPMLLTVTPETSLEELFRGFGFGKGGNLSGETLLIIIGLMLAILVLFGFQLVALAMGLYLARKLGKSVDGLFRGVTRLSAGDFNVRIRPLGRDQVASLTAAFNEMAARLQRADAEREERLRMEEELRVAREVQMRLLPDLEALQMPSVRATILPAREVAGDYYDLFPLADGSLAFLILDVSGKGTSAAFYAAETKGVLSALDKQTLSPVEVADRLNGIWCQGHARRLFLTMAYGTFHPRTGRYQFVRAGHPSAFLRRADGRVTRLHPRGLGVGLSATRFKAALESSEGTLEPGDSLIFYTDGLSEAQAPDDAFYGEDRLEALLAGPSEDLQATILTDVAAFTQGRPLADDLTLLILKR
jgi:serine phosphatase RsbU (regulator of sigma subunit)